ncbi:Serine/threonine-protein kinase atg1 [Tetrabaena socialis]|uniref:Serine/threonine-protein kinase atg1 n=1 Tax=Tetrabaena socialis TaxID=47790 RepID=A0A2J8AAC4_9CHLO|nr:Serine/threonine-protein kinase atg1 [Tetrabaena socialis]|eukprot:PNH09468.1 Serine/threonine-protein kinase atg1 [Tetrabaena socialis]
MARPSTRRTVGCWEIDEVIGSGSFAIVWKARHVATGELAAVKEILTDKLNRKLQESLNSEIAVLQRVKHANIVGLLDLYKEPGKIFLVLEFCGGGDLAHHLTPRRGLRSRAAARDMLRQMAEGLKIMRQHNIIHRDLKPQNLLLSDTGPSPTLKIADFGFARSLQPAGLAETLCGSPLYMAPEVLQLHKYDAKADLWSVGTILFELLAGKPPFNGANHLQLVQNIERGDAVLPEPLARTLSPACRQLLHQLLRRNPVERISFDELFAHPFLLGEGAAAAAAAAASSGGGAASSGSASSNGGGGGWLEGGGAAAGAGHLQLQQRRHQPVSQGAVRFVQPTWNGNPVHPAFQGGAPPPPSAAPPQQQPQLPQQQCRAPAPGSGVAGLEPGAALNVRELTRSPSPRIVAAAAAMASAMMADGADAGPSPGGAAFGAAAGPPGGPTASPLHPAASPLHPAAATQWAVSAGGGSAATCVGGGCDGSGAANLEDSTDSDYVVVSSPSAVQRPPQQAAAAAAVPRTLHPAMAVAGGSRGGSAGGAAPGEAAAAWQQQQPYGMLMPQQHAQHHAQPLPQHPLLALQAQLSPIAAATLPPSSGSPYGAAAAAATGAGRTLPLRASAVGGPPEGGSEGDLLQRVVHWLLDSARLRCSALLDLEAEVRQGGDMLYGGGGFGPLGGFGASGFDGGGAASAAGLAEEAAAAIGTLLVACRLLAAALGGALDGGGLGGSAGASVAGDRGRTVAAAAGPLAAAAAGSIAGGGDASGAASLVASLHADLPPGAAAPAGEEAAAAASLTGLAALARSALLALDEHLSGTVGQLLHPSGPPPSAASLLRAGDPPPASASSPLVPCAVDTLMAVAVRHSRAAAGEEMLGNAGGAVDQYGRAADVLAFLLAAPPPPPSPSPLDSVRPPLAPHDRQRLLKYYAAVRLRQAAAQAAAATAAAGVVGGALPPYNRSGEPPMGYQAYGHGNHHHPAQPPVPYHQQHQQQTQYSGATPSYGMSPYPPPDHRHGFTPQYHGGPAVPPAPGAAASAAAYGHGGRGQSYGAHAYGPPVY